MRTRELGTSSAPQTGLRLVSGSERRVKQVARSIRQAPLRAGPLAHLAFSATFAALTAFVASRGPQPFTDVAAVHFGSIDDQAVLLVGMDGAEPAEWTRLTQKALDSGALTVGSVLPPSRSAGWPPTRSAPWTCSSG